MELKPHTVLGDGASLHPFCNRRNWWPGVGGLQVRASFPDKSGVHISKLSCVSRVRKCPTPTAKAPQSNPPIVPLQKHRHLFGEAHASRRLGVSQLEHKGDKGFSQEMGGPRAVKLLAEEVSIALNLAVSCVNFLSNQEAWRNFNWDNGGHKVKAVRVSLHSLI